MNISERADAAGHAVCTLLGATPDGEQMAAVRRVLEQAIVNAVLDHGERCTHAAIDCCGEDRGIAHRLTAEMQRQREALVANLSSLR